MTTQSDGRKTATLLMSCRDQKGLVNKISEFIFRHNGNILHADQHIDFETGQFFSRVEWDIKEFKLPKAEIAKAFTPLGESLGMEWQMRFSDDPLRTAIFVSKLPHCLDDLLYRPSVGGPFGGVVG